MMMIYMYIYIYIHVYIYIYIYIYILKSVYLGSKLLFELVLLKTMEHCISYYF